MKKIIVFILLCLLFPTAVYADDLTDEIKEAAGVDGLSEESEGDIGETVLEKIKDSALSFFKKTIKFFCSLLSLITLFALFGGISELGEKTEMKNTFNYISCLCLSGVLYKYLFPMFEYAADSLNRLCEYMAALIPVTASLYTLGGKTASGVAGSSALLMFMSISELFASEGLMPLLRTGFVFSVAAALPGNIDMRSIGNFLKNTLTTLLAFVFTLFGIVMYFQSTLSASADNYAFRTVKFLSGVFIPVIGNIIGDAAKSVSASLSVVKSSVGIIGITAVLCITVPPIIYIILYKICVLVSAMLARMMGLERPQTMLYEINGFLSVLMALSVGTAVIFIIALAIFINIGVGK